MRAVKSHNGENFLHFPFFSCIKCTSWGLPWFTACNIFLFFYSSQHYTNSKGGSNDNSYKARQPAGSFLTCLRAYLPSCSTAETKGNSYMLAPFYFCSTSTHRISLWLRHYFFFLYLILVFLEAWMIGQHPPFQTFILRRQYVGGKRGCLYSVLMDASTMNVFRWWNEFHFGIVAKVTCNC